MLTLSSLRLDIKCGRGATSAGKKCHKGVRQKANKQSAQAKRNFLGGATIAFGVGTAIGLALTRRSLQRRPIRTYEYSSPSIARIRDPEITRSRDQAVETIRTIPADMFMSRPSSPIKSSQDPYIPRTPEERRVNAAWTARPAARTTSHSDPNPDVSAAWKRRGDSVWAQGFNP